MKLQEGVIYGPVSSRRLKKSLGINLFTNQLKVCNFNCVYCQYGRTEKYHKVDDLSNCLSVEEIVREVARYIAGIGEARNYIDYITISGNGESTLHPQFSEVVDSLITIRDEMVPSIPIALLSNGSMLGNEKVRKSVSKIDLPVFKLDIGTEDLFKKVNRPASWVGFDDIITGLKEVSDFVIQSLFFHSDKIDNTLEENLSPWLDIISNIKPNFVQIYTIDRGTAEDGIKPATKEELERIVNNVKKRVSINAILY